MSGKTKKYIALGGGILVLAAISVMKAMPANHTVHTVCEISLSILGALGFTAPISIMNPTNPDGSDKTS